MIEILLVLAAYALLCSMALRLFVFTDDDDE